MSKKNGLNDEDDLPEQSDSDVEDVDPMLKEDYGSNNDNRKAQRKHEKANY